MQAVHRKDLHEAFLSRRPVAGDTPEKRRSNRSKVFDRALGDAAAAELLVVRDDPRSPNEIIYAKSISD